MNDPGQTALPPAEVGQDNAVRPSPLNHKALDPIEENGDGARNHYQT